MFIDTDQVLSQTATFGLSEQEVRDSFEVLEHEGYIELLGVIGGSPS